jgi:hypothetical protein
MQSCVMLLSVATTGISGQLGSLVGKPQYSNNLERQAADGQPNAVLLRSRSEAAAQNNKRLEHAMRQKHKTCCQMGWSGRNMVG